MPEIDVALRQDGSAAITQVWTEDKDEGTESYFWDEMSIFPTDVFLTIRMEDGTPLTDESGVLCL